jgi:hypothetical protein
MSHTLRKMQHPDGTRAKVIGSEDLPTFWGDGRLPTPQQRADNLILWIGDNQETPAKEAKGLDQLISAAIGMEIFGLPQRHHQPSRGRLALANGRAKTSKTVSIDENTNSSRI